MLANGEDGDCTVLDYADAFKHCRFAEEERRYLGGHALDGHFCYTAMSFGVKSGPLCWGRVGALVRRLTVAVNRTNKARLRVLCR